MEDGVDNYTRLPIFIGGKRHAKQHGNKLRRKCNLGKGE